MKVFKFDKPCVTSSLPPKPNCYWVKLDDNKISEIKEFVNNKWETLLVLPTPVKEIKPLLKDIDFEKEEITQLQELYKNLKNYLYPKKEKIVDNDSNK